MSEPWILLTNERAIRACLIHADHIERLQFDWRDRPRRMPWEPMLGPPPLENRHEENTPFAGQRTLHIDYIYRLPISHFPLDVHLLLRFGNTTGRNDYRCNMESRLQPIRDGRFEFTRPLAGASYEEIVRKASEQVWDTFRDIGARFVPYATAMTMPGPRREMFVNDHGGVPAHFFPDWTIPDWRAPPWHTNPPAPAPKPKPSPPEPVQQIEIIRCRRNIIRSVKPKQQNDHE